MADKSSDPLQMWRDFLGEMETRFNAAGNRTMESAEFSRAMNQFGSGAAGLHKAFIDGMERYLKSMNLPSREQVVGLGERLQAIESQLGEIRTLLYRLQGADDAADGASRPPRTKRPPSQGEGGAP